MAPPNEEMVFDKIEEIIRTRTGDGEYLLFEWTYLLDEVRRAFRTTTPAVRDRMEILRKDGRLKDVPVSNHGFAHYTDDLGLWPSLYFRYASSHREEWGKVGIDRPERPGNSVLWKAGRRPLFTTPQFFEAAVEHFTQVAKRMSAAQKAADKAEDERLWALVEKSDPDAREILEKVAALGDDVTVESRLLERAEITRPVIEVGARNAESVSALLAVLRKGLAD